MQPDSKFAWKGHTTFKVSADLAGRRLHRIRRKHGGVLAPEHVVTDARDTESPLHHDFEWDDAKAAGLQRIGHAKHMIRSLVVARIETPDEEPVRAFVSVRDESDDDAKPVYRSIEEVLADPVMRRQMLSRALAELDSWKRRYERLEELVSVHAAIDEAHRKAG